MCEIPIWNLKYYLAPLKYIGRGTYYKWITFKKLSLKRQRRRITVAFWLQIWLVFNIVVADINKLDRKMQYVY